MNSKKYNLIIRNIFLLVTLFLFVLSCGAGEESLETENDAQCNSSDYHSSLGNAFQNAKLSDTVVFSDGQTLDNTNVCDECHSSGGTFDGVNNSSYGAKTLFSNGETPYDSDGSLKTEYSKWCAGCHDESPSKIQVQGMTVEAVAANVAGDNEYLGLGFYESGHGLSSSEYYMDSNRRGAQLYCTDCHDCSAAHIGITKYDSTLNNYQAAYRLKSISGETPLVIPRKGTDYDNKDFALCYSCHDEANVVGRPNIGYNDYAGTTLDFSNESEFSDEELEKIFTTSIRSNFRNVNINGANEHYMDSGAIIDLTFYYYVNSHWSHLALADKEVPIESQVSKDTKSTPMERCSAGGGCHEPLLWDSDHDSQAKLDSRISCTACHNPHGTNYPAMTNNDLQITHVYPADSTDNTGSGWEYGYIGSGDYGLQEPTEPYDLYCKECHGGYRDEAGKYGKDKYKYYK